MVEKIIKFLSDILGWSSTIEPLYPSILPPEPVIPVKAPEQPTPVITQPKTPIMTNTEKLYEIAKACIGSDMSPNDVAPDSLACAESLNGVFKKAFGENIGNGAALTSTAALYQVLKNDPRFVVTSDPQPGDIVISPSGTSTKGSPHGHCGIRGITTYMSNDSSTGKWEANYNLPNWKLVFHDTLGFEIFHFKVVG